MHAQICALCMDMNCYGTNRVRAKGPNLGLKPVGLLISQSAGLPGSQGQPGSYRLYRTYIPPNGGQVWQGGPGLREKVGGIYLYLLFIKFTKSESIMKWPFFGVCQLLHFPSCRTNISVLKDKNYLLTNFHLTNWIPHTMAALSYLSSVWGYVRS